jgi:polysaccharide export outer membrane protein
MSQRAAVPDRSAEDSWPSGWGNSPASSWRAILIALGSLLAGCGSNSTESEGAFAPPGPPKPYTASEALKKFDADLGASYRLGEGDVVTVQVWDRADLSGPHVVGPDGMVTLAVAGPLRMAGLTREEAAKATKEALSRYYDGVSVTVRVDQYVSNRVIVLGRVKTPGVQRFDSVPTLLEALSRAGGLLEDPLAHNNLTHCAVIRGRDRVAMLDLRSLLEAGDLSLNLRLKADDVVLIPDWADQPVYVLGQVTRPGPLRWTQGMTVLDALSLAGGVTRDSMPNSISLVRPSQNLRLTISQYDILEPLAGANLAVVRGDIIYVPTNLLADIGYLFEKLNPFGWVFVAQTARTIK